MDRLYTFFGRFRRPRRGMTLTRDTRGPSALADDSAMLDFAAQIVKFRVKNPSPVEKCYKIDEANILGQGSFGTVCRATHIASGTERAIKQINKMLVAGGDENDTKFVEWKETLLAEIKILSTLKHVNVIHFYEYFETKEKMYIVMDLCLAGDLFSELEKRATFKGELVAMIIRQTLSALAFCHSKGIVHRDVKPENIALETVNDFDRIKLIDFGAATYFESAEGKRKLSQSVGTLYYMAPEVFRKDYDEKCDIWSLGVVSYILTVGFPPFVGRSSQAMRANILNAQPNFHSGLWSFINQDCVDLISSMLVKDKKERATAEELLTSPFLDSAKEYIGNKVWKATGSDEEKGTMDQQVLANIKGFNTRQKLKQVVLSYVVSHLLPKSVRENMADVFRKFDVDGDGVLNEDEIAEAYQENGDRKMKIDEMVKIFMEVDQDHNGKVEYNEFLVAASEVREVLSPQHLDAVFDVFDIDGDGYIDAEELKGIFGFQELVSEDFVDRLIAEVDTDNDGRVSKQEFIDMLSEKAGIEA